VNRIICTSTLLLLLALAGCLAAAPLPEAASTAPAATPMLVLSPTSPPATATPSATPMPSATATPAPTEIPSPTLLPQPVHLLRSYPIDGDSDVLPGAPLRLVFNQPMDPDPAALGLSVSPELSLTAEWPAPNTLALHTGPRRPGTEYRLTLQRARGQSGGMLEQPLAFTFGEGGRGAPIPILMYHHVDDFGPSAPAGVGEWASRPGEFVAQLDLLAGLSAHVVRLIETVDYLTEGAPLPARPAVITFDDGNKPTLQYAVPVLQERGLPATFFVPPQYAESGNDKFFNWEDLKALAAAGFDLGGHSYQHSFVQDLTPAEAEHQIGDEKRKIEELTGAQVECFAYPFGSYSDKTVQQLQHYGYRAALTVEQRIYQKPGDIFHLGRIRMGYGDPIDKLRSKLPWSE